MSPQACGGSKQEQASPQHASVEIMPNHTRLIAQLSGGLLGEGRAVRFRATGRSMLPTIRDGEFITVEPIGAGRIRRGDIVLYRSGAGVTAHRVIEIRGPAGPSRQYHLQGDSTRTRDVPVEECALLGRITLVDRCGRSLRLAGVWQRIRFRFRTSADLPLRMLRRARGRQSQAPRTQPADP